MSVTRVSFASVASLVCGVHRRRARALASGLPADAEGVALIPEESESSGTPFVPGATA
jgi:hypothetical protein